MAVAAAISLHGGTGRGETYGSVTDGDQVSWRALGGGARGAPSTSSSFSSLRTFIRMMPS